MHSSRRVSLGVCIFLWIKLEKIEIPKSAMDFFLWNCAQAVLNSAVSLELNIYHPLRNLFCSIFSLVCMCASDVNKTLLLDEWRFSRGDISALNTMSFLNETHSSLQIITVIFLDHIFFWKLSENDGEKWIWSFFESFYAVSNSLL